jgi:predicted permease
MTIRPDGRLYSGSRTSALYADLDRRFSALPGVASAAVSMDTPLGGVSVTMNASVPGQPAVTQVNVNSIGPRFFETYGIPLLAGREFTRQDDATRPPLAIITQSAATALSSDRNPLGLRIEVGNALMEVVGVVKDARYQGLRDPAQPMVYRPYFQTTETWGGLCFAVRTSGDTAPIAAFLRRELREAARDVPVSSLKTLDAQVDANLVRERLLSMLSASFGTLALLLAAIGLYGRLSYTVVERTREIGVRLALGAQPGGIVWMILREVLLFVCAGVVIGIPLAIASTRAIRTLLYGMEPADPLTLAAVVAATFSVTLLAAWLPARRASRQDPMIALR